MRFHRHWLGANRAHHTSFGSIETPRWWVESLHIPCVYHGSRISGATQPAPHRVVAFFFKQKIKNENKEEGRQSNNAGKRNTKVNSISTDPHLSPRASSFALICVACEFSPMQSRPHLAQPAAASGWRRSRAGISLVRESSHHSE